MKQVIITIRDLKKELVAREYYYSQSQFNEDAGDFLSNNMLPGMEADIKMGNLYRAYMTYEDFENDAQDDDVEAQDEMYDWIEAHDIQYYLKQYLPKY